MSVEVYAIEAAKCQRAESRTAARRYEGMIGMETYDRVPKLQLLLFAVCTCLILFRLLGAPDRVSLFSKLIL